MGRILDFFAIPLLLVALVWTGAVIWLQQSTRDVTGGTLLLSFVGLPLAILIVWFGTRALLSRRKEVATASGMPAEPLTEPSPAPVFRQSLAILATELNTFAADDANALAADIMARNIRPQLSERFLDSQGLPIMAAAADSLDEAPAAEFLEAWAVRAPETHPVHSHPEQGIRLLALLAPPLQRASQVLAKLAQPADSTEGAEGGSRPPLLVKLFAPKGWEDMLEAWLQGQLADIPGALTGFVRDNPTQELIHLDALRVAEAFRADLERSPSNAVLMIVACDSLCTEAHIDALDANGMLFASTRQDGVMPGEAAAVILVSGAAQSPLEPMARLHSAISGERDKPVDADARCDFGLIQHLAEELLERHGIEASSIACIASDCDQRKAWNTELAAFVSASLSKLDPVADHLAVGRALGHTGVAAPTLTLVLGVARSLQASAPCIVASVASARNRSLSVISPWTDATT